MAKLQKNRTKENSFFFFCNFACKFKAICKKSQGKTPTIVRGNP